VTPDLLTTDPLTDDELTALALAADPDFEVDDDAVPFWDVAPGPSEDDLLPAWYMPSPRTRTRQLHGWRRSVVLLLIASFILINAAGLCVTYGWVQFG
jgi:hypothetical protein